MQTITRLFAVVGIKSISIDTSTRDAHAALAPSARAKKAQASMVLLEIPLKASLWGMKAQMNKSGDFTFPLEVTWVDPDGVSHRAGVRKGDVVVKVNGVQVDCRGYVDGTPVICAEVQNMVLRGGECTLCVRREEALCGKGRCSECGEGSLVESEEAVRVCDTCGVVHADEEAAVVVDLTHQAPQKQGGGADDACEDGRRAKSRRAMAEACRAEISAICSNHGLNEGVYSTCLDMCVKYLSSKKVRCTLMKESIKSLVSACLLLAFRARNEGRSDAEIFAMSGCSSRTIFYKWINNVCTLSAVQYIKPLSTIDLIPRFCSFLWLDPATEAAAVDILAQIEKRGICFKRRPASKAAVCIAMAIVVTEKEIPRLSGQHLVAAVSQVTGPRTQATFTVQGKCS